MPRILLIDDDPLFRTLFAGVLEGSHWKGDLEVRGDPEEALSDLVERRLRVDLVLSDISMPGLDGFEFLEKLRMHEHVRGVPVFFYTGSVLQEDRERAHAMGCAGVLQKPMSVELMERQVALLHEFVELVG